jgi:hypothetical protein
MIPLPVDNSTLGVFLLLLPGFVTLIVERSLAYQREEAGTTTVAKALVYSFVIYAVFYVFALIWRLLADLANLNLDKMDIFHDQTVTHGLKVLLLLVVSILLGLGIARLKMTDWHMRRARKMHLTKRTARSSIWIDIFQDYFAGKGEKRKEEKREKGAWVTVHLKDGRRIFGWPQYYADAFEDGPVLFLNDAKWINRKNEEFKIAAPGIFVMGSEIKYIEFKSRGT